MDDLELLAPVLADHPDVGVLGADGLVRHLAEQLLSPHDLFSLNCLLYHRITFESRPEKTGQMSL